MIVASIGIFNFVQNNLYEVVVVYLVEHRISGRTVPGFCPVGPDICFQFETNGIFKFCFQIARSI